MNISRSKKKKITKCCYNLVTAASPVGDYLLREGVTGVAVITDDVLEFLGEFGMLLGSVDFRVHVGLVEGAAYAIHDNVSKLLVCVHREVAGMQMSVALRHVPVLDKEFRGLVIDKAVNRVGHW